MDGGLISSERFESFFPLIRESLIMMDLRSKPSDNLSTKLSPIESIPEDVSLHLVSIIRSWAAMERGGSLEEKEARRK